MSKPELDEAQLDHFFEAMAELAFGLWQSQQSQNTSASVPADSESTPTPAMKG
jgi:hypothetical protein